MSSISRRRGGVPRKIHRWIFVVFVLAVLSDATFGMAEVFGIHFPVSPGVLIRGWVLVVAAGFLVSQYASRANRKLLLWPLVIVFSVIPSFWVGMLNDRDLVFDVVEVSKAIFLPTVAIAIAIQVRTFPSAISLMLGAIEVSALLYSTFLVVPNWLGIGLRTYGDYAYGSSGFFQAGNDLSATLGMASIAVAYRLIFLRFSPFRLFVFLFSIYACTQIGNRASLVFVGVAVAAVVVGIFLMKDQGSRTKKGRRVGMILLGIALVVSSIWFGLNSLNRQMENQFQVEKFNSGFEGGVARPLLYRAGMAHIERRDAIYDLIGEGADGFQRGVAVFWKGRDRRQTEIDWVDALGSYGLPFMILSYLLILVALVKAMQATLRYRDPLMFFCGSALFAFFGHSVLAGHALFSPSAATIAAAYIAILFIGGKPLKANVVK